MIPATASGGVFINFLPANMRELEELLSHASGDRVVRFKITGPGVGYYRKRVGLTWKEDVNYRVSYTPAERVEVAGLATVDKPTFFSVDVINNREVVPAAARVINSRRHEMVTVIGWAVDGEAQKAAGGVFVSLDGGTDVPADYGQERKDVAAALGNAEYQFSGFTASFPTSLLKKGPHTLTLKIVTADRKGFYEPQYKINLVVR